MRNLKSKLTEVVSGWKKYERFGVNGKLDTLIDRWKKNTNIAEAQLKNGPLVNGIIHRRSKEGTKRVTKYIVKQLQEIK